MNRVIHWESIGMGFSSSKVKTALTQFFTLTTMRKLLILGIVVVLTVVNILMQLISVSSTLKRMQAEQKGIEEDAKKIKYLEYVKKNADFFNARTKTLEYAMPNSPMEDQLVSSLYVSSQNSLGNMVKVSFEPRKPGDGFTRMPMTMNFEGNFESLLTFLGNIETGDRMIRVEQMSIRANSSDQKSIKAQITASAFHIGSSATQEISTSKIK